MSRMARLVGLIAMGILSAGATPNPTIADPLLDSPEIELAVEDGAPKASVAPLGSVCLTSRGRCFTSLMSPQNSVCQCDLPGFGLKRGAVVY